MVYPSLISGCQLLIAPGLMEHPGKILEQLLKKHGLGAGGRYNHPVAWAGQKDLTIYIYIYIYTYCQCYYYICLDFTVLHTCHFRWGDNAALPVLALLPGGGGDTERHH